MTDRIPRPAAEWVGPDDSREDVAMYTERALVLRSLDVALRTQHALEMMRLGMRLELNLIKGAIGLKSDEPEPRPRMTSSHDLSEERARLEEVVQKRWRNPGDPMNSDRVREIYKEVTEAIATNKDAALVRRIRAGGWGIALKVAEWVVLLVLGALLAHYGIK